MFNKVLIIYLVVLIISSCSYSTKNIAPVTSGTLKTEIEKKNSSIVRNEQRTYKKPKNIQIKDTTYRKFLENGIVAYKKGSYKQSISLLTKAINYKPTDYKSYYFRALSFGAKGKHKEAINDFNSQIKNNTPSYILGETYYFRGVSYFSLGKYNNAKNDFQKAIAYKKGSYLYRLNLAKANVKLGNINDALQNFLYCTKLNEKEQYCNLQCALILESQGKLITANKYFKKVYSLDSSNLLSFHHILQNKISLGNYTDIINYSNNLPSSAEAYYFVGFAYSEIGENEKSKNYLEKAKELADLQSKPKVYENTLAKLQEVQGGY